MHLWEIKRIKILRTKTRMEQQSVGSPIRREKSRFHFPFRHRIYKHKEKPEPLGFTKPSKTVN